jgi:hypothetical protein
MRRLDADRPHSFQLVRHDFLSAPQCKKPALHRGFFNRAAGMQACCSHVTDTARGALCAGDATDEMPLLHFAWHFSSETRRINLLRSAPSAIRSFATTDETGGRSIVSGPLFFRSSAASTLYDPCVLAQV